MTTKILTPSDLLPEISRLKALGKKVVQCHGVFDLVHPGHLRHFQAARREGDILVVSLTADRHVNKGPGRPIFPQLIRAEFLASFACIDFVTISESPTAVEMIRQLRPDVYVKGIEYADREKDITGKIYDEEEAVKTVGGRIHFTNDITFSSSNLINTHFNVFPPEAEEWLKDFRRRRSIDEISECLESLNGVRALVVGEAILDEYVFCNGLGKSTKDPILAFQYQSTETYAGGSLAVANHLAGFCKEVGILTMLGEDRRREDFVRSALRQNVETHFVTQPSAPTIHKRRFVDTHTGARMFELYMLDDNPLPSTTERTLLSKLEKVIDQYDVIVVTDYGHGMMIVPAVRMLCDRAKFLSVNTQANAGNRGFNTISKYSRADYVCLAGHEIALETRMRHAPQRDLILDVAGRVQCPKFTVTQGKAGTLHYTHGDGFTEIPALASKVADRVGAGDAVLALTSLLVAQNRPWDIIGFLGNIAGAQMVADLGNRVTINRVSIEKHMVSLMK